VGSLQAVVPCGKMMRKAKKRQDTAAHLRRLAASILSDGDDGDDECTSAADENSTTAQARFQPLSMSGFSQFVLDSESDEERAKPVCAAVPSRASGSNSSGSITTTSAAGVSISTQSTSSFHFSDSDDAKDDSFEIRPPRKCSVKRKDNTKKAKKSASDLTKRAADEPSRSDFKCRGLLPTLGEGEAPLPGSRGDTLPTLEREKKPEQLLLAAATENESIKHGDDCVRTEKLGLTSPSRFGKTIVMEYNGESEIVSEKLMKDVAVQVDLCRCTPASVTQRPRLCEVSVQACLCDCPEDVNGKPLSVKLLTEDDTVTVKHFDAGCFIDDCLSSALSRVQISDAARIAIGSPALPHVQCNAVADVQTVVISATAAERSCHLLENKPMTDLSVSRDLIPLAAAESCQEADLTADESLVSVCDVSMQTSRIHEASLCDMSPQPSAELVEVVNEAGNLERSPQLSIDIVNAAGTPDRSPRPSTEPIDVASIPGTPESLVSVCDVSLQTSAVDSFAAARTVRLCYQ
jgi:hypothetical protein